MSYFDENGEQKMKVFLKSIVKIFDWLSCVIPHIFMVDYIEVDPPINPIEYGIFVFGGLIVCACGMFGMFFCVGILTYVVVSYPITSCLISLVLGLFIGIGYLRKKIK